ALGEGRGEGGGGSHVRPCRPSRNRRLITGGRSAQMTTSRPRTAPSVFPRTAPSCLSRPSGETDAMTAAPARSADGSTAAAGVLTPNVSTAGTATAAPVTTVRAVLHAVVQAGAPVGLVVIGPLPRAGSPATRR